MQTLTARQQRSLDRAIASAYRMREYSDCKDITVYFTVYPDGIKIDKKFGVHDPIEGATRVIKL